MLPNVLIGFRRLPFIWLSSGFCGPGRGSWRSQDLTAPQKIWERIPTCFQTPGARAPPPPAARAGPLLPVPGSSGHGAAGAGLLREPRGPHWLLPPAARRLACLSPRLRRGAPHRWGEVSQEKEEEEAATEEEAKEEEETG